MSEIERGTHDARVYAVIESAGWVLDTPGMYCATYREAGSPLRHMIVEAVPGGGWDWAVWLGNGSGQPCHGSAATCAAAMASAETSAVRSGVVEPGVYDRATVLSGKPILHTDRSASI